VQRLLIVEREPSHKSATDAERMDVAVLAFNRRRHIGYIAFRSLDNRLIELAKLSTTWRLRPRGRVS
jgi:hypothetical protein